MLNTRRFAIVVGLVQLAAVPAAAQDVPITPRLRAGDELRLEIARSSENSARPQQNGRSRALVTVRVVSATPAGCVLDWTWDDPGVDAQQAAQDPVLAAAARMIGSMVFRLTLNADGGYTGLANAAEVAPKLQSMADAIVQGLAERFPAAQRGAFQKLAGQILSPDVLIGSATHDAQTYFGLNGLSLAAGEFAEVAIEQPSPVGGGVIPATVRVEMATVSADSATLTSTTTYASDALLRMTLALAQQAGQTIPPEEIARMPAMEMSDEGRHVFDRQLGVMREVIVDRRVSAGPMRRHDNVHIRLISGPKR